MMILHVRRIVRAWNHICIALVFVASGNIDTLLQTTT
jgi:hypothetical protein